MRNWTALKKWTRRIACVGVLVCAGCAPLVPKPTTVDPVKVSLERIMVEVDQMPTHSAMADASTPQAVLNSGHITVRRYIGEARNLLSRLAAARGMKFSVGGPEPRLPLLITVDVEGATLEELLSMIGHQFGQRANLVLSDDRIEIRYRGQP
jgi:hypothetical protein